MQKVENKTEMNLDSIISTFMGAAALVLAAVTADIYVTLALAFGFGVKALTETWLSTRPGKRLTQSHPWLEDLPWFAFLLA